MEKGSRIFILGAGFSVAAGLPTAKELWAEVLAHVSKRRGRAERFEADLQLYLKFQKERYGALLAREEVDFEDFLSFLDYEHFLKLSGSDTWSEDGNESQVMIKYAIGKILSERTPDIEEIPDSYFEFANLLTPHDTVITFNYDILLEKILSHSKTPFRRFPERYSEVNDIYGVVDVDSDPELVLLKLHGSIDWVSRGQYRESIRHWKTINSKSLPPDPVFGPDRKVSTVELVEGERLPDDPLSDMHRIPEQELGRFYSEVSEFMHAPWLLAPSKAKSIYAKGIQSLWYGLGSAGVLNYGLCVIGYSLPDHDDYVSQLLFRIARNYQDNYWGKEFMWGDRIKSRVFLIDKVTGAKEVELKRRFGFFDSDKTTFCLNGFDQASVNALKKNLE